jgi:uncharacterized protein
MLIDSHCHIFTNRIVQNMKSRPAMVKELGLNVHDAQERLGPEDLSEYAQANGVDLCLLLPTALPDRVPAENDRFIGFTKDFSRLLTLGTLHPMMRDLSSEVMRLIDFGINGFKFCSFSQKFDISSPAVETMLAQVERVGRDRGIVPALVFDTFVRADFYFESDPNHLTTPSKLGNLIRRHPGINFIAAHMGGLLADFDDISRGLAPAENLYLDTSNASHTLQDHQFIELLRNYGSGHILFGTDWPWFLHAPETLGISSLLVRAGYDELAQRAVFGGNAVKLFGIG